MSVTVYQLEHSPYCIPITRALEALGVPFQTRNVANGNRAEIITLTGGAHYQVPVLAHGDNVIFESSPISTDIAHYVDRTFADGRLFPAEHEGFQRIVIGHIENDIEGVTFKLIDPFYVASISDPIERTMVIRHKERKFGVGCEEAWAAAQDELLQAAGILLKPYDITLAQRAFLFGDAPLYADFALYGVLGNMTYKGHVSIPTSLPALIEWFGRMKTFRF